jgi:hypothetical protein
MLVVLGTVQVAVAGGVIGPGATWIWPLVAGGVLVAAAQDRSEGPAAGRDDLLRLLALLLLLAQVVLLGMLPHGVLRWLHDLIAALVSTGASRLLGYSIELAGPYALVWTIVVAWLCALALLARGHPVRAAAVALGWPPVAMVMAARLHSADPAALAPADIAMAAWPMVPLLASAVLAASPWSSAPRRSARRVGAWAGAVGMLAALAWMPVGGGVCLPGTPREAPRLAVCDDGYQDWKVPEHGRYGVFEGGMFGLLPDYLARLGIACGRIATPLTPAALAAVDVLTVINPQRMWSDGEMEAVRGFVAAGGTLLVLGDHTDILGSMDSLNRMLSFTGVRFHFDSAFPAHHGWVGSLACPMPRLRSIEEDASRSGISVGASLAVAAPARSLVTGTYAHSDLGNRLNVQGAFLGNYAYDRGERVGDIPLVAMQRHGDGRVLVLGDTSTFQNGALVATAETFVPPLMDLALGGTVIAAVWWPWTWWTVSGLVIGLAASGLLVGFATLHGPLPRAHWCLVGLAAWSLAMLALDRLQAGPLQPVAGPALAGHAARPLACIAIGDMERVGVVGPHAFGYGGLQMGLARDGFLPLLSRDPQAHADAALIVYQASLSFEDPLAVERALRFVREGGSIILASGARTRAAANRLLARVNLALTEVPLGAAPVIADADPEAPRFRDAFALAFKDPQATDPGLGYQVLWSYRDLPVVVGLTLGRGRLVVIGDEHLLGDDALENMQGHHLGNIRLLSRIVGFCRGAR